MTIDGIVIGNTNVNFFEYKLQNAVRDELRRLNGLNDGDLLDELTTFYGYTGGKDYLKGARTMLNLRLQTVNFAATGGMLSPMGPSRGGPNVRGAPTGIGQAAVALYKYIVPGALGMSSDYSSSFFYSCGGTGCNLDAVYVE